MVGYKNRGGLPINLFLRGGGLNKIRYVHVSSKNIMFATVSFTNLAVCFFRKNIYLENITVITRANAPVTDSLSRV